MTKRILVVDDDPDTVAVLEDRLRAWGFDVETARDGAEALVALGRGSLTGMTLGLRMPRMNGVEVLRRLRQTDQSLPVVVISAGFVYLNESDLKFLRENAQALLPKPYRRDEFKQMVDQWFGLPPRDEALRDLAIGHAKEGQIEAAKQAASQIADRRLQRWAWMQILYAQFFILGDLTGVKKTIASLPNDSLWNGIWVLDLLSALIKAGDSAGALEVIGKLTSPDWQKMYLLNIASLQAQNNDWDGVERTLVLMSGDTQLVDSTLATVARKRAMVGDLVGAKQFAARIKEEDRRETVLRQIDDPTQWSKM